MAYFKGSSQRGQLVDTLVGLLTSIPNGAVEPYWKAVQSGPYATEGVVLYSKGSSGTDNIFIRLSSDAKPNKIYMSIMEDYKPNPVNGLVGTAVNEMGKQEIRWTHTEKYDATFPVYYDLSFDRDRIMLSLMADKQAVLASGDIVVNAYRTFAWMGLPKRLSPVGTTDWMDSTAVCYAGSRHGMTVAGTSGNLTLPAYGVCRALRDRGRVESALYDLRVLGSGFGKSRGWGGKILLSDVYMEKKGGDEGPRAIMHGIHPLFTPDSPADFKDGDELVIGGKRYTIMQVYTDAASQTNCFPSPWLAVEKLL